MDVITKIFQVANLVLTLLFVVGGLIFLGAVVDVLGDFLGLFLIVFLPILIGYTLTLKRMMSNRRQKIKMSKIEMFLSFFPIFNFLVILGVAMFSILAYA